MNSNHEPQAGSYEAALTEDQRDALHALLLSDADMLEVRQKAPLWPHGPEQGRRPSIDSLWRIKQRLNIEDQVRHIEMAQATIDAMQPLVQKMVSKTNMETLLDQVVVLVAQEAAAAGLPSKATAARMLLQRAGQHRFDQRTAIFEAKIRLANNQQKTREEKK